MYQTCNEGKTQQSANLAYYFDVDDEFIFEQMFLFSNTQKLPRRNSFFNKSSSFLKAHVELCVIVFSCIKMSEDFALKTETCMQHLHSCINQVMKQIICAVLFGLLCSNSAAIQADQSDVLRNDSGEIETKGVVQSGRLVNGIGVRIERYKFAVSLRYFNQYVCGASIITPSHALTSAFCATKYLHVLPWVSCLTLLLM